MDVGWLMWIYLSHVLTRYSPCYDDGPRPEFTPDKQIAKGDSSNTFFIKLLNHIGTHVDAPYHFDPHGRKISSYKAEELVFEKPLLIDVDKEVGELITASDLERHGKPLQHSDLLLIRTGFQRYREKDPEAYMKRGPCLSAEAASFLRQFINLRALGVDMISISSPMRREEGREAHRRLLVGRSFLIIEDMDLIGKPNVFKRVVVAPLIVDEVDSAPCTVLAEV
ncbi:MAG: cyclase family protein [Candidatus Caldarchaeum sp.]